MQTDSTDSRMSRKAEPKGTQRHPGRRRARLISTLLLLVPLLLTGGCFKRSAIVTSDLLKPMATPLPWLPTDADIAAVRLARAALVAEPLPALTSKDGSRPDPRVERAMERLTESVTEKDQRNFVPLGLDLRNATLDDPIADRDATRKLRRRRGLDPRLKSRLDRIIADDPLRLARRRVSDGWHRLWARTFNAVSEPLGNSLITGFVIAPFQLVNSIIHYFAEFSNSEPLSFTGRQALRLRKDFLAAHPDTRWTPKIQKKVDRAQVKLEKTLALRRTRASERSLDADHSGLALHHANAAVEILSAHPKKNGRLRRRAKRASVKADKAQNEIDRLKALSLGSERAPKALRPIERELSTTLLSGPASFERIDPALALYLSQGGSPDRAEFIRATAQLENGFEAGARKRLARVAARPAKSTPMARHANALLEDPWQNPYRAFRRLKRTGRREEVAWRIAGEWVNRPRYPNLPVPVAYLIDTPTIAMTIILAPIRAIFSPWTGVPDFQRAAALAGYRYLRRHPGGDEQRIVLEWLYGYEKGKERWDRALRLADIMRDFDPEERAELVEKAAEARLAAVERLDRRDTRASLLKGVARDYPDSQGGHQAGLRARDEFQEASPQHIRITRDFLRENPDVAGPNGIGLNPRLLNGDPGDGELHEEGVVLRGGRVLEIRLMAEGMKDKDPPESRIQQISKQRLVRTASALDEAVQRNSMIDVDARHTADANRDVFLERAGLGLTEEMDLRPTAESSFVYQSLRERYGMVRGRDSVLPFDLVFRGSLGDFTLGAFPRWRPPRETPDAFLYR
jgi:hypothetical protein